MFKDKNSKQELIDFLGTVAGELLVWMVLWGLVWLLFTFGRQIAIGVTVFGMFWLVLPMIVCAGLLLRWLIKNTE